MTFEIINATLGEIIDFSVPVSFFKNKGDNQYLLKLRAAWIHADNPHNGLQMESDS